MREVTAAQGSVIGGRYRLERKLGEGGMGTVWAATHLVTRRSAALKLLKPSLVDKPEMRQRFLREASAASALRHRHVVDVLDIFDIDEQMPVLVMELLEGETLGAKLARDERLGIEETASVLLPVVSAVAAAHELGIVHRDLKPDNIFLARAGESITVKVLDFGIAKLSAEFYLDSGSVLMTDPASVLGTPCYMAPEQITGKGVDHRADIWSIGVILYECLSGVRPIEGQNVAEVVARLIADSITPLDRVAPGLPHEITALAKTLLMRDLGRRAYDLSELATVLTRYTAIRIPPLGAPRVGSAAPPARVVAAASGAHAQAAALNVPTVESRAGDVRAVASGTLISAPAVGIAPHREFGSRPRVSRPLKFALASVCVAVLATLWLFGRSLWNAASEQRTAVGSNADADRTASDSQPAPSFSSAVISASIGNAPTSIVAERPPEPDAPALHENGPHLSRRRTASESRAWPVRSPRTQGPERADEEQLFSGRK